MRTVQIGSKARGSSLFGSFGFEPPRMGLTPDFGSAMQPSIPSGPINLSPMQPIGPLLPGDGGGGAAPAGNGAPNGTVPTLPAQQPFYAFPVEEAPEEEAPVEEPTKDGLDTRSLLIGAGVVAVVAGLIAIVR